MIPEYNFYMFPFIPFIPPNCDKPPTMYQILNSIVNGDKEPDDYSKIKDLAKEGRTTIFNFDYPLSSKVSRETFEETILNHYMQRRIGFETVTAFRIALSAKLNEIMPMYNKMFDALENWNIFEDGQTITKTGTNDKASQNNTNKESFARNNTVTDLNNTAQTSSETVSDRRYSQLPQDEIENVQDGSYLTDYNYDTNTNGSTDTSSSKGLSETQNTSTDNTSYNGTDNEVYTENTKISANNKIEILKEMQANIKSIYSLIFNDLNCLFYGLV